MAIKIKTDAEILMLKKVGLKLGRVFDKLKGHIVPGVSTKYLDSLAKKYILEENCKPSFLGYEGFPGSICASVNDTLIHGIPSEDIILADGDIISIDMGNIDNETGFQGDACRTFTVGNVSSEAKRLIECTERCFYEAMKIIKPGIHVTDISEVFTKIAKEYNYSLVEEFGGHGIGREMHEDPMIPNCGKGNHGPILRKNMAIAVEPMVLQGKRYITCLNDGWTIKSCDHKLTCHYENTLVITDNGCEITTVDSSVISYLGGNKYE